MRVSHFQLRVEQGQTRLGVGLPPDWLGVCGRDQTLTRKNQNDEGFQGHSSQDLLEGQGRRPRRTRPGRGDRPTVPEDRVRTPMATWFRELGRRNVLLASNEPWILLPSPPLGQLNAVHPVCTLPLRSTEDYDES
jgi:hypothetical protein